MNTIICVKHVPDSAIVRFDLRTKTLTNVQYAMDPIDEVTVSEAIKIRERVGGKVTALTLGPARAEEVLRTCLKMGVDEVLHLCHEGPDDPDPCLTSELLAQKISSLPYDLILCGRESMDACNGYVGIGIAELLHLPIVTAVTRIDVFADTNSAVVHRRLRGGDREIVETPLPAVLTVDTVLTKPIYPRLRTILRGLRKNIVRHECPASDLHQGALQPAFSPPVISQPKPRLKKTATIDSSLSPHERMKLIASGGVQDKGSKTVNKPPREAAAEIVQFLLSNGIISKPQR